MLIVLEGVDGAGKTTVALSLLKCLKAQGRKVSLYREPGSTALGESIRSYVIQTPNLSDDDRLILMTAARVVLSNEELMHKDNEEIVLLDRYTDSSVVYQFIVGHADPRLTWPLVRMLQDRHTPDLVIYFKISPALAIQRLKQKGENPTEREIEEIVSAYETHFRSAMLDGRKIVTVDASMSVEQISDIICQEILKINTTSLPKVSNSQARFVPNYMSNVGH